MNAGDMIRFRERNNATWNIGLLVRYQKWEKVAEVLYKGKIIRIHARYTQLHKRGTKLDES